MTHQPRLAFAQSDDSCCLMWIKAVNAPALDCVIV